MLRKLLAIPLALMLLLACTPTSDARGPGRVLRRGAVRRNVNRVRVRRAIRNNFNNRAFIRNTVFAQRISRTAFLRTFNTRFISRNVFFGSAYGGFNSSFSYGVPVGIPVPVPVPVPVQTEIPVPVAPPPDEVPITPGVQLQTFQAAPVSYGSCGIAGAQFVAGFSGYGFAPFATGFVTPFVHRNVFFNNGFNGFFGRRSFRGRF